MHIAVVTLFPEMFTALTQSGITSRAIDRKLVSLDFVSPRDYAEDRHKTVDDKPYGGGPGMVMTVPPLRKAIEVAKSKLGDDGQSAVKAKVVYLSPQGEPLSQPLVEQLANEQSLVLLCGRYEGIDERIVEADVDMEVSLGDYVISGGELAAMVLMDAMIRLQPGALGDKDSAGQDSFSGRGWFDCPHYTRPDTVDGQTVPEVLLSGDHRAIERWRTKQSLKRTLERRPELLNAEHIQLTEEERQLIKSLASDKLNDANRD